MKTHTTITYDIGDAINGTYKTTTSLEEAMQIYNHLVAEGAKFSFKHRDQSKGNQDWTFDDFLSDSKKFHYINKVTTTITVDDDGDEDTEEEEDEIIEGGFY